MRSKQQFRRPLFLVVALNAITFIVWATDLLRWQMVRGFFFRPGEIDSRLETVVIIDPMYTPTAENRFINPAYTVADYVLQLADVNIDIIHYPEANTDRVLEHNPVCVLISGQTAPWIDYEPEVLAPVFDFLTTTDLPVLGICGGHQLIAQAYGVLVAPMGYKELGYIEVDLPAEDPLLKGIDSPATFFSWHGEEVKAMPEDFINLGSSDLCAVQIFRHRDKEIFGVQFHPELSGRKPDGRVLLLNFFEGVGVPLR
jgi:GMP synthase (glutamine-hydrolysing)